MANDKKQADTQADTRTTDTRPAGTLTDPTKVAPKSDSESKADKWIDHGSTPSAPEGPLPWTGGHYSGKAFRVEGFLLAVITIFFYGTAMAYGAGLYHRMGHWFFWGLVMVIPIVLWIRFLFRYWYRTSTIRYELKEDRLISHRGLFRQTTDTTLVLRINDVQLEQTLWDKLINGGIGTVIIYSTDPTDPELRLACLDRPRDAFNAIDQLVSDQAKKRGIKTFGGVLGTDDGSAAMAGDNGISAS